MSRGMMKILLWLGVLIATVIFINPHYSSTSDSQKMEMAGLAVFTISIICLFGAWVIKRKKDDFNEFKINFKAGYNETEEAFRRARANFKEPDSHYYEQAEQEINDGSLDKGLWAMALVKAKGNEVLRKPEYIKLRARQLQKTK